MTNTWRCPTFCSPSCFNNCPTTSATPPPMPTSTSSNIMVGILSFFAVTTRIAKLIRDNSPPEATLPSGRGATPACPATKNSTCSSPLAVGDCAVNATSNLPPLSDRRCISALICALNLAAAALRPSLSLCAFCV